MDMLVHVVLVILMSEAWGLERGNNQTSEKSKDSALDTRITVEKTASFKYGVDVNLTCGDKTWIKDKILFIIWHLNLTDKTCEIRCREGVNVNKCLDLKSLRNTTKDQPILHIPHFSYTDVGNYTCECVYTGGVESYIYSVNITAPPNTSSWIERRGDRRVAVCRAERGSPAANISWTFTDNVTTEMVWESDGLISVQSTMDVSAHEDLQNLSCIVTHPYWDKPRVIVPALNASLTTSQNQSVLYATVAISVVFCLALLLWGIIKLHNLRRRQKSSSKSPPEDYVEEVEPYESYVQRVNSIYNSSRDLFA